MKNENEIKNDVDDPVARFRKECAEVTVRFAEYPPQYLEWFGFEMYEAVLDALKKKRVSKRVMSLLDGVLLMLVAAEQAKVGKLDPATGYGVAERFPELARELVEEGWSG